MSQEQTLKTLLVAAIPFVVLFIAKRIPYLKNKPWMVCSLMMTPSIIAAFLLFG
jgi:hypothetical protein